MKLFWLIVLFFLASVQSSITNNNQKNPNVIVYSAESTVLQTPKICPKGKRWDDRTQACHQPIRLF